MVEEARLESVYTPKAYRGFESPSLRTIRTLVINRIIGVLSFAGAIITRFVAVIFSYPLLIKLFVSSNIICNFALNH